MMIVLLGAPGAGKGTQALVLADHLGLRHLSTGELFRAHQAAGTSLGREVSAVLNAGGLVTDDVVVTMVSEAIDTLDSADGVVLDGFPRTLAQAEALDRVLAERGRDLPRAIEIFVPEALLIDRLTGRRVSRDCGHTYHVVFKPPKVEGRCDVDGSELYQRDDDKPETVARRLALYAGTIGPVKAYYRATGRLAIVDGVGSLDEVERRLREAIDDAG